MATHQLKPHRSTLHGTFFHEWEPALTIAPGDSVVCILTGHQLKDPTATVAYHGTDQENFEKVLGSRGVHRAGFANRPVMVANDLDDIIRTIALYSEAPPAAGSAP